jgi:actin-related protein
MKDKPLMSGVPTWSSSQELAKLTELAFERFEVGAFYAARNAVLR